MHDLRDDVRRAYNELVSTTDTLHHAAARQLALERMSARPDPDLIASLELNLVSTTQLVDLLESAVSLSVQRLTEQDRQATPQP